MGDFSEPAAGPPGVPERRAHLRRRIRSLVYVETEPGNGGIVLDASEGGVSVQAVGSLAGDALESMRMQMPGGRGWVDAPARVVWTQNARKVAGLAFAAMSGEARGRIAAWLADLDEFRAEASAAGRSSSREAREERTAGPGAAPKEYAPPAILPVAAPAASAAQHDFARPFGGTLTYGREQAGPGRRRGILLAAFAAVLALASLAVGWAAGHGDLRRALARMHLRAAQRSQPLSKKPAATPQ